MSEEARRSVRVALQGLLNSNAFLENINRQIDAWNAVPIGTEIQVFFDRDYQEKRLKADERSIELLRSWLTPEQLLEYNSRQRFFVRGSETGERYLITSPAQAYNVAEVDDNDDVVMRLCFVPTGGVDSRGDVMLAQKIMLETDELEARAIANRLTPHNAYFRFY